MRCIPARAVLVALFIFGQAFVSEAGLLDSVGLIYSESFTGETAFPTTPDLNPRSFSGVTAVQNIGNGTQTFDLSTRDTIHVVLTATAGAASLEQVIASATTSFAADESVGIRGRFFGFDGTVNGAAQMSTGVYLSSEGGSNLSGGIQRTVIPNDPPNDTIILILFETGAGAAPYQFVTLTPTATAAVEAGDPYFIDLFFDRTLNQAQTSITVGAETITTQPLTPNTFAGVGINKPAMSASVANFIDGNPPFELGRDDSLTVDFDGLQLFAPEPSALASAAGAVATLAGLRRRRSSRATA